MHGKITIVYELNSDGWITSYIPEIPGAISQGRTESEARVMVLDALRELMASRLEDFEPAGSKRETLEFEIFTEKSA